jgi:molecular chaperone HscB
VVAPDYFSLFGLPEQFELDRDALEKKYLELSRALHPDKHVAKERLAAVQQTTDLNQAYKVLRDDFRRAELLLRRQGFETSEQASSDQRQNVDPTLLVEVMELRESLDGARVKKDMSAVDAIEADVKARSAAAWQKLRTGFADGDDGADLAKALTSLRYYLRVFDEIERIRDEEL